MRRPRAIAVGAALLLFVAGTGAAVVVHPRSDATWGFLTGDITDQADLMLLVASGGGVAWGGITGTLSNQTDLQTELDGKEDVGIAAAAVAAHVAAADPHTQYQKESEKDAANGYAGLSAGSKIAGAQQTYGIGANTAAEGNDARLSDARTPLAHKTSHQDGGTDEVSVTGLSGLLADGQTPLAHKTSHQDGGTDEVSVTGLSGLLADGQTPLAHATSHQNGGADEVSVTGLSGLLADGQTPLAHKTSHQNGGADEVSVTGLSGLLADGQTPLAHASSHQNGGADEVSVTGLSGLLADGQTPLAHASSHQSGGGDAIKLDDLATPDDNTDLNASTTRHGLLLKLTGSTANFLRADGTWAAPTASVAISVAEIDFGTKGVFEKTMTVTDAAISATSRILITQAGIAATGRQADENELDGITCRALPATGTFTVNCSCRTLTHGKFNVWYTAS